MSAPTRAQGLPAWLVRAGHQASGSQGQAGETREGSPTAKTTLFRGNDGIGKAYASSMLHISLGHSPARSGSREPAVR